MKLNNTVFVIICLLGVILCLNSCSFIGAKSVFSKKKGAIPPEFGSDPENILIFLLSDDSRYNRKILRLGREIYKGKFVFLSKRQMETEEYSDKNIYRYIFQHSGYSSYDTYDPNSNAYDMITRTSTLKIGMYDRKEEQRYFNRVSSTQYSLLIRSMLKNLEKERKKMQDN